MFCLRNMEIKPDTRLLTQAGDYQKIIEPEKCRSTQWAHSTWQMRKVSNN